MNCFVACMLANHPGLRVVPLTLSMWRSEHVLALHASNGDVYHVFQHETVFHRTPGHIPGVFVRRAEVGQFMGVPTPHREAAARLRR